MKKRTLGMVFSPLIAFTCTSGCAKNEENTVIVRPEAPISALSKQPP